MKMIKQDEIAILVVSFDKYSDIWNTFDLCINKHWSDRKFNTYLVTNDLEPNFNNITIIKTGKESSWSNRVRIALQKIKEKYLLVLLEDYLIDTKVDNALFNQAVSYLIDNNIDYLRIAPIPILKGSKKDSFASEITDKMVYGVNLQAALWNKEYLLKTLYDDDFSAWEFEARQKFNSPQRIKGKCYATHQFIISYLNGIIQGKWYNKTLEALECQEIIVDKGNRLVMTDKDMKRERVRNFLLHSIPPKFISLLKPVAKRLGMKFVTK